MCKGPLTLASNSAACTVGLAPSCNDRSVTSMQHPPPYPPSEPPRGRGPGDRHDHGHGDGHGPGDGHGGGHGDGAGHGNGSGGGHGHSHSHGPAAPVSRHLRRVIAAILIPFTAAVVVGLVVLWPGGVPDHKRTGVGFDRQTQQATVTTVVAVDCKSVNASGETRPATLHRRGFLGTARGGRYLQEGDDPGRHRQRQGPYVHGDRPARPVPAVAPGREGRGRL